MYDWANSAFATTVMAGFFPIFFKSYFSAGVDVTVSTAKLGVANTACALLVGLASPLLGSIADSGAYKKPFLLISCVLGAILTGGIAFLTEGDWQWSVVLFVLASFFFSASCAFYDSLLTSVTDDSTVDYVSALGYGVGYLGGGLLFAINVFMYLKPEFFGLSSGIEGVKYSFISVAVWWIAFSIPLALWVKESKAKRTHVTGKFAFAKNAKKGFLELLHTLPKLLKLKMLLIFLLAFFLYNDAVGTTIKMAVDYGMSIGFKSSDLISALLLVQFVGFPCAILFGYATKHVNPKKALIFAIFVYIFVVLWAAQMNKSWEFYILASLIGLVQGGVQALSRSFYSRLIPSDRAGEFYGFFNLFGRFAGLIGPVLMGFVGLWTASPRLGLSSIILLFVSGGVLLCFVDEQQAKRELKALDALN